MDTLIGKNPVLEALRAGRPINKIMLDKDSNKAYFREIVAQARERGIMVQFVDKKQLDVMTGNEAHQGIMAHTAAKEYTDWEEVLKKAQTNGETPLLILLDGVEDPHNLGAVLRTADAVKATCVVIPRHRAVPLTSGVARASAGAVEYVPVSRVTNLAQVMEEMKAEGLWIVGADQEADITCFEADLTGPLAIVMGSENKGLGRLIREKCDYLVKIPMRGQVNSLNVSVAASVILYEIMRQRDRMNERI